MTVYGQGSLESRSNTQAACYGYNGEYTHGSLGLQYLRARYLKVETGTFTSRDTYAGRVRDILSQNRYTYAENNPVTFADPSGHKITFGTMMGNMFGGGRNTGRNGGIGGLMANTAQKIADKVANTARAAQNTTRSAVNLATGNPAAAAKNQMDNLAAQAAGGITGTLGGGNSSVNNPGGMTGFVESVAAQIEAARCQAYERCKDIVQEVINNVGWDLVIVYAILGTKHNPLLTEQQIANAEYIYRYLRDRGWSLEAICGLLGNIHEESGYNPGVWEVMNDIGKGYGLAQWTDEEGKFLQWLKRKLEYDDNEDMANIVNNMANTSPKELMNYELEYLLETCQPGYGEWIPTTKYDCPEEMSYETYITTTVKPKEDAEKVVGNLALIFHGSYERSADEGEDLMDRAEWANRWYAHFQGTEDIRNHF